MTTLTVQVEANQDDGEREWDDMMGDWNFDNSGNYVRMGNTNAGDGAYDISCYFRFEGVDIPQGATINSAKLQYMLSANYSYSGNDTTIYGANADTSGSIDTNGDFESEALDIPTAGVTWALSTSTNTSSFQDSADITVPVQQIVNRSGWNDPESDPSDNMTIFLTNNTEAGMMSSWEMRIRAYDDDSAKAVKLVVDYTEAGAAVSNPAFLLFMD